MAQPDWSQQYVSRWPRHEVRDSAALEVRVERAAGQSPSALDAELLDLSRAGFRLRVPYSLVVGECVTLRLRHAQAGIDLALPGKVRWQHADKHGAWLAGCAADCPAAWETLGELFLNNILSADTPS